MARPLRIEYEGALYHVTARGKQRDRVRARDLLCYWVVVDLTPSYDLDRIAERVTEVLGIDLDEVHSKGRQNRKV